MLGPRLGKWGGQLLGLTILGIACTAPTWRIRLIVGAFGVAGVLFERWRAPDSVERVEGERRRLRDEQRRRASKHRLVP